MNIDLALEAVAPLLSRLRRSDDIGDDEVSALSAMITERRTYATRAVIVPRHQPVDKCLMLVDGFVVRQIELPNGRRQILAIHVPGDFLDLHGLLLKSLDHEIVALSPATVAEVPHDVLRAVTEEKPHLARMLWFLTTVDAAIHREWIASLGRTAAGRIAHLLCELQTRLEVVGRSRPGGFALPLTQIDIADATALTPVHVNRTLRSLREEGVVDFRSGLVSVSDNDALQKIAGFQPDYLYLERQQR